MHNIFHTLRVKLHTILKMVCGDDPVDCGAVSPRLTVFERIQSPRLRKFLYSTLVILTYVLLSRTLKFYFIENIPAVTAIYAIASRVWAVVIMLIFLLFIKQLPKKQFIFLCAVYAFMGFSTVINGGNLRRFISAAYPILSLCAFVILMCRTVESTKRFVKTMATFFTVVMAINLVVAWCVPELFGRTTSNGVIFLVGIENQMIYSQSIGLLFAILHDRLNGNKFILQLYTATYAVTTLVNFSASAVVGVCVLLLYFAIPHINKAVNKGKFVWMLGVFAIVFTALVFFSEPVLNFAPIRFVIEEVLHKTTTLTHRTVIWDMVVEGIAKRPVFGYGLGDTGNLFKMLVNGEPTFWSAHNQYLQFAYEYGLVTLALFVGFVLFSAKKLDRAPDCKISGSIKAVSFSIMVMYLVEAPSFNALIVVLTLGACVCRVISGGNLHRTSQCPDKITVVIPVYNIDQFLPECLDSVINQSYTNLEILVVNDGSTDDSLRICNEYASKDDRIQVISQENGGLSAARNTAIKAATGKYITFVDSDDYIHPDMIRVLYTKLVKNNADMSVCQFTPVDENSAVIEGERYYAPFVVEGNGNCMREFFMDTGIKTCAWGKLHRTAVFEQFMYPVGKYHEDVFTTYRIVDLCEKIVVCSEPMYFYRQRSGSIMHHSFSPKHLDAVHACLARAEYVNDRYKGLKVTSLSAAVYSANVCVKRLIGLEKVDRKTLRFLQRQYRKYELLFLLGHSTMQAKVFSVFAYINLKQFLKVINISINFVRRIKK